jgi:hypothetical protein
MLHEIARMLYESAEGESEAKRRLGGVQSRGRNQTEDPVVQTLNSFSSKQIRLGQRTGIKIQKTFRMIDDQKF